MQAVISGRISREGIRRIRVDSLSRAKCARGREVGDISGAKVVLFSTHSAIMCASVITFINSPAKLRRISKSARN